MRMLGRVHDRLCDCNEVYVSGAGEKCNRRYGNKRQRVREKRTEFAYEALANDPDYREYHEQRRARKQ